MLDFPNSPTVGQVFPATPIVGVPSYSWDGTKWTTIGAPLGIVDAPNDGKMYGRESALWARAVGLAGDTMTGMLTLSGNPGGALDAATKGYVDSKTPVIFAGSGTGHGSGLVPDPGNVAGTARYLREDASFALPGLASLSNVLTSNLTLTVASAWYDGPSVAQGTVGTWLVNGYATIYNGNTAAGAAYLRLWDGTTVFASGVINLATHTSGMMSISAIVSAPAGNLRLSSSASLTGFIVYYNASGLVTDTAINAIRIA